MQGLDDLTHEQYQFALAALKKKEAKNA